VTVEPPEILNRMFPTQEDKRRCLAGEQRLRNAATMRVTSPAGTDFTLSLGEFRASCQYGFADQPGRWDQWPGAFVYSYPNEGSANGIVVLDRGDMLFPQKAYIETPIRLTVRDGYITDIAGGSDARDLADMFKSFNDPEVFAISHLGWGLSHNGKWEALRAFDKADIEGQDGRAFYGNFLFSTGPNVLGGGTRAAPCHIDAPMRNCSLYLDDEPIVLDGDVVPAEQKIPGLSPLT
jgi:2,5-dihydroxypyridine 5,6-dioxygenase